MMDLPIDQVEPQLKKLTQMQIELVTTFVQTHFGRHCASNPMKC